MIHFEKNQIEVTVATTYITERLRDLIADDEEFQNNIKDQLIGYLHDHALCDREYGWLGEEPDCIVINIPLTVYPTRGYK